MPKKIPVVDEKGKKTEELSIEDKQLKTKVDPSLIHQVVRAHLSGQRKGTAATKRRGEVRGGGVKPWRQKGTGRARAGSIRSPLWTGGGVVFGPKPRDFSIKLPKKAKRQALKSVLGEKISNGSVKVLNKIDWNEPKTKKAVKLLDTLKMEGKVLAVIQDESENVVKSFLNIPEVKIISADQISTYEVLNTDDILTTRKSFEKILKDRF